MAKLGPDNNFTAYIYIYNGGPTLRKKTHIMFQHRSPGRSTATKQDWNNFWPRSLGRPTLIITKEIKSCCGTVKRNRITRKRPGSETQAKILADIGEKRGKNLAKTVADFCPSISRQSGRKKFHEKSSTICTSHETTFVHRETLGIGRPNPVATKDWNRFWHFNPSRLTVSKSD